MILGPFPGAPMRASPRVFSALGCAALLLQPACALEPREVFAKASRSVVVVYAQTAANQVSQGSGVALGGPYVATNCHVVESAEDVRVTYRAQSARAFVYARNSDRDVCILSVPIKDLPAVSIGAPSSYSPGSRVYAIGSPKGLDLSITEGLVSGIRTTKLGDYIQTSAAISHGSSGGGLFNEDGALVGLTTFFLKDGQSLNFAVPVGVALVLLQDAHAAARPAPVPAPELPATRPKPELDAMLKSARMAIAPALRLEAAPPAPLTIDFQPMDSKVGLFRWREVSSVRLAAYKLNNPFPDEFLRREFLDLVWTESNNNGLRPSLVLGLIDVASSFRKFAVHESGARGFMQVGVRWVQTVGDGDASKLFNTGANLRYGCVFLGGALGYFDGDVTKTLGSYYSQATDTKFSENAVPRTRFVRAVLSAQKRWEVDGF
jgi:S1-C subfamily serine protease